MQTSVNELQIALSNKTQFSFSTVALRVKLRVIFFYVFSDWCSSSDWIVVIKKVYCPFGRMGFNCLKTTEPIQGDGLYLNTKSPGVSGTHEKSKTELILEPPRLGKKYGGGDAPRHTMFYVLVI